MTFTTPWENSADNKLTILFLFFPEYISCNLRDVIVAQIPLFYVCYVSSGLGHCKKKYLQFESIHLYFVDLFYSF